MSHYMAEMTDYIAEFSTDAFPSISRAIAQHVTYNLTLTNGDGLQIRAFEDSLQEAFEKSLNNFANDTRFGEPLSKITVEALLFSTLGVTSSGARKFMEMVHACPAAFAKRYSQRKMSRSLLRAAESAIRAYVDSGMCKDVLAPYMSKYASAVDLAAPVTTEVETGEPVTTEVKTDEPVTTEVKTDEPVTTEVKTDEPVTTEVKTDEPVTTEVAVDDQLFELYKAEQVSRAKFFAMRAALHNHQFKGRKAEFINMVISGGADVEAAEQAWEIVRENLQAKVDAAKKEYDAASEAYRNALSSEQKLLSDFTGLSLNDIVARCVEHRPADNGQYDFMYEAMAQIAARENDPSPKTMPRISIAGAITSKIEPLYAEIHSIVRYELYKDRQDLDGLARLSTATTLVECFNTAIFYHMHEYHDQQVRDWYADLEAAVVRYCARYLMEEYCRERRHAILDKLHAADAA